MNILVIYAHPDDAEFLAGGSIAKWVEEGHRVHAISATDGSLGTRIPGQSRAQFEVRRTAQKKTTTSTASCWGVTAAASERLSNQRAAKGGSTLHQGSNTEPLRECTPATSVTAMETE